MLLTLVIAGLFYIAMALGLVMMVSIYSIWEAGINPATLTPEGQAYANAFLISSFPTAFITAGAPPARRGYPPRPAWAPLPTCLPLPT